MTSEIEAEGVLFTFQTLLQRQLARLAVVGVDVSFGLGEQAAKQVHVAALSAARRLLRGLHRFFHRRQQNRPIAVDVGLIGLDLFEEIRTQTIQRTGANQRLKGTLVDPFQVDPRAEVEQVLE